MNARVNHNPIGDSETEASYLNATSSSNEDEIASHGFALTLLLLYLFLFRWCAHVQRSSLHDQQRARHINNT